MLQFVTAAGDDARAQETITAARSSRELRDLPDLGERVHSGSYPFLQRFVSPHQLHLKRISVLGQSANEFTILPVPDRPVFASARA
jgi:hypothetical protein